MLLWGDTAERMSRNADWFLSQQENNNIKHDKALCGAIRVISSSLFNTSHDDQNNRKEI